MGGVDIAQFPDLRPFTIAVLHPGRTLIEKVLRMNSFIAAGTDEGREKRGGWARIGRQFYDVWALLGSQQVLDFLADEDTVAQVLLDCERVSAMFSDDAPIPTGGFAASGVFTGIGVDLSRLRGEHQTAMEQLFYEPPPGPSFDDVLDPWGLNSRNPGDVDRGQPSGVRVRVVASHRGPREVAMITEAQGDLLDADVESLVNAVNTVGFIGKGIALRFKTAYPAMFEDYRRAVQLGHVRLGSVHVWETGFLAYPRYIMNVPTKGHWREPSRMADVESGLVDLARVVREASIGSVAIPALGCGLGGLSWSDVEPRIRQLFGDLPHVRVLLFAPGSGAQAAPGPATGER